MIQALLAKVLAVSACMGYHFDPRQAKQKKLTEGLLVKI